MEDDPFDILCSVMCTSNELECHPLDNNLDKSITHLLAVFKQQLPDALLNFFITRSPDAVRRAMKRKSGDISARVIPESSDIGECSNIRTTDLFC